MVLRVLSLVAGLMALAMLACTAPAGGTGAGAGAGAGVGATNPPSATTAPKTVTTAVVQPTTGGAAAKTFTDPFAYCQAAGTIDRPDARFTGPAVPPAIITGLVRAATNNPSATPTAQQQEAFSRGTIWRCMAGQVYACNVGANIPCDAKANTNRNPAGTPMATFCAQNPNSQVVPGAAMDRSSVFEWTCRNGQAEVVRQVSEVDAAGYPTNYWTRINPT